MSDGTTVAFFALVVVLGGVVGTVSTGSVAEGGDANATAGVGGPTAIASAGDAHTAPTEITGCTTITEPGEYVLAGDVANASPTTPRSGLRACVAVRASDVVVDGRGHAISAGDGGQPGVVGVLVGADHRLSNVTVRNLTTTRWGAGVAVVGVADATLLNVSAVENLGDGFFVERAPGATLRGGVVRGANTGVFLRSAPGARVADLTVTGNIAGVAVRRSDGATVGTVDASRNRLYGVGVFASANATVADSTLRGNGFAGVALSQADDNRLRNLTIAPAASPTPNAGDPVGVYLNDSSGNRLVGVSVTDAPGWSVYATGDSTANLGQDVSLGGARVAFVTTDVALDPAETPSLPGNRTTVGDGILAAPTDPEGVATLTLRYANAAVLRRGVDEETLALWRSTGDEDKGSTHPNWSQVSTADVAPAGNVATATFEASDLGRNGTVVALAGERRALSPTAAVLRALGGRLRAPRDPDGDGLSEDVNGDGEVGVADAAALGTYVDATQSGWLVASERRAAAFDFDGDGNLDWSDVSALLAEMDVLG